MNSLTFLYIFYMISIMIHVVALIVTLTFVIPLQIKEAQVKNGLASLRKKMLLSGLVILSISIVSIIVLTLRFFVTGDLQRYIAVTLVFLHSLGLLIFALIKSSIYREQYTEKNKNLHEEIAKHE